MDFSAFTPTVLIVSALQASRTGRGWIVVAVCVCFGAAGGAVSWGLTKAGRSPPIRAHLVVRLAARARMLWSEISEVSYLKIRRPR